jgi:hypothetical protein
MRFLIYLLMLLTLLCFSALYVVAPWLDLQFGVERKVAAQDFHGARQLCAHALALKPSLFYAWANERLGEVSLAAAEAELRKPAPGFSAAQDWLAALVKREGDPTGSEGRAAHMLKELPGLHYNYARQMLQRGEYEHALSEFGEIGRLYPDDPVQQRLRTEAHIAEVETARALNDSGDPEAAINRLAGLEYATHLPPVMVQKAQSAVPELAERAIRGRIRQGNVGHAFELMESLRSRFDDPEVSNGLSDVRARIDLELFNVALESGVRGKAAAQSARPDGPDRAIVRIRNGADSPMKLIYVGPQRVEVDLPAHGERTFELVPGRYLSGAYWPASREIRPIRREEVIREGMYSKTFEVSPQPLGGALPSGLVTLQPTVPRL